MWLGILNRCHGSIIRQIRCTKDEILDDEKHYQNKMLRSIELRLREMENMERAQDIVAARPLSVCFVVRESELSHLLARYVQNAHSLSLMHEKHPQAIISYAHLEM